MRIVTFGRALRGLCVACGLLSFCGGSASAAETPGAGWYVSATSYPTVLSPGGRGTIEVDLFNIGAAATSGQVTVTDRLPAGVTARQAGALSRVAGEEAVFSIGGWECTGNGGLPGEDLVQGASEVTCTNDPENLTSFPGGGGNPTLGLREEGNEFILPAIGVAVNAPATPPAEPNRVAVTGGGAGNAAAANPIAVGSAPASFAFTRWDTWFSKADGEIDTQAGSHPYEWTVVTSWATLLSGRSLADAGGEPRDLIVNLPPGVIADPYAVAQCTRAEFAVENCPHGSLVGVLTTFFNGFAPVGLEVFNLVPPVGGPAELAFYINGVATYIEPSIRAGGDYGVNSAVPNIPQRAIDGSILTLWGVPDDPSHERWRGTGGGCTAGERARHECLPVEPGTEVKPYLTVPTACEGPLALPVTGNTWGRPVFEAGAELETHEENGVPVGFSGCGRLPFEPSILAKPTTGTVDSASGLEFDLHLPQQGLQEPEGLAEADLKDTTLSFPAGLALDPSAADGLQACSEQQAGFTGFKELNPTSEPGTQTPQFTPAPAECPEASKLGTVQVNTPVVGHPLLGGVYLARQSENPFGSLLAIYIAIDDPVAGVVVKLPGRVEADPVTGRLTAVVDQSPQLPFEDFKIDLFNGSRAPFTTPPTCGVYTTSAAMTPWSAPEGADATPSGSFELTGAPGGGACPGTAAQEPFAPSFSTGTFTPIAREYSPLVLRLGRENGSQTLGSLSVTLPKGLLGKIAGVEECPQADIEAAQRRDGLGEGRLEESNPSCPAGSELGLAHVGVGAGAPFYATGHAYLAGPYDGAPFSVVVITPAVAGPLDLGAVVVRNALFIDPATAQVTVKSDPFPTIIDGIPLDLRSIEVLVTRSGFTLNPTSCEKMAVAGTVVSTQGVDASVASPFQVGGCNNLPFKPDFTVSTNGKASRLDGASLVAKVVAHPGEANLARVDVQLPKQLPARLPTLQKACTEAQFNSNPAGCPAASDVAAARVQTPLLNAALTGPVYFVSHGGAAFPDLVMVLQGEGVRIDLVGNTQIKNQVTYSRFEAVPDAPISSFELDAPQGPYSILSANLPPGKGYDLCGQALTMPTTLTGQNGVVINENTQVATTGCPALTKKTTASRGQKLARALRACRHRYRADRQRRRRAACERAVRRGRQRAKRPSKHGTGKR
jgi:hypothetical protein